MYCYEVVHIQSDIGSGQSQCTINQTITHTGYNSAIIHITIIDSINHTIFVKVKNVNPILLSLGCPL